MGCWFGDGATSEGDWHEGLNFAGIHRLPVIFVCENNHYAISVPQSKQMAVENVADRAAGYGFPGVVVDGNDVLACYEAMKVAHERARAGEGPTLIECKTYRFLGHTSDDDDKTYRPRDEVEEARHHDPIERFGAYLQRQRPARRVPPPIACGRRSRRRSTPRIAAAWEAPDPLPETALRHVFAEEAEERVSEKNLVTAIRDALHDEMVADDRVILLGEDVGNRGGVFRDLRRVDGGVRRGSGDRHPARGIGHRRCRHRHGAARAAAGGGDPVRRLHLPGLRPDRVRGGAHAVPHRTARSAVPVGDPHALWRRDPRRALPLAVDRGVLRARSGLEGGHAVHPGRRCGAAAERPP